MAKNKHCIAMILAGGQGSRLYALTNKIAKPAVPFGGKYRIIDFPLSNCINSGIDTVGVLTQYQPLLLNEYIGNGQPWDLDRTYGGVHILPPYQAKNHTDWYRGTANAIYQNIHFINSFGTENTLILGGDHIYKMNYADMLDFHIKQNADCTIAVLEVPIEEAPRFGIMNTDDTYKIISFEEKPEKPKSNLASMGIYIFKTDLLKEFLAADDADETSSNDFGKNVIPAMLAAGKHMAAYPFEGYWKDVGTIASLWEANMDLLGEHPVFDIFDSSWVISSRNPIDTPQYHGSRARVENSLITGGCVIEGEVVNSIIGNGVKISQGAVVRDSIIFSRVTVGRGAMVDYSVIDEGVEIGGGAHVGGARTSGVEIAVIGRDVIIEAGAIVNAGNIVE